MSIEPTAGTWQPRLQDASDTGDTLLLPYDAAADGLTLTAVLDPPELPSGLSATWTLEAPESPLPPPESGSGLRYALRPEHLPGLPPAVPTPEALTTAPKIAIVWARPVGNGGVETVAVLSRTVRITRPPPPKLVRFPSLRGRSTHSCFEPSRSCCCLCWSSNTV